MHADNMAKNGKASAKTEYSVSTAFVVVLFFFPILRGFWGFFCLVGWFFIKRKYSLAT